jgi:hypothetical protein
MVKRYSSSQKEMEDQFLNGNCKCSFYKPTNKFSSIRRGRRRGCRRKKKKKNKKGEEEEEEEEEEGEAEEAKNIMRIYNINFGKEYCAKIQMIRGPYFGNP